MTPKRMAAIKLRMLRLAEEGEYTQDTRDLLAYIDHLEGQPLPEARLAEIEARADAATPGPWTTGSGCVVKVVEGITVVVIAETQFTGNPKASEDKRFIAAARADIPELLSFVRFLLAQIHDMKIDSSAYQMGLKDGSKASRKVSTWVEVI